MDSDTNADFSVAPITPSRNSNRHELLWENLPNCTDEHWEEIGRTPKIGARPRNYSKTVNLSDRRRTLSEGQDWFDELSHTDFDEVFLRDKFVPFRDDSSKVSGSKFKEARDSRSDVSEEEVFSQIKNCNWKGRKICAGPRVLDSGDFSSSSDDVLHGPAFYMESGTDRKSLISQSTTMHTSGGNSPEVLLPKNNRRQLGKDISRAAKQLKYSEPSRSRRQQGQRNGSLSAAVQYSKTLPQQNAYSAIDWPLYEGLSSQKNPSGVNGGKLAKEIFHISNQALSAKIDQPARSSLNPPEFPLSSDEDGQYPNDEGFASSRDSYEHSTSKNSCSQETSPLKAMFAWNICFDPTPMKSDRARSATVERKESLPSTSRKGTSDTATQFQPGTSRKKWDKTSKNPNLVKCRDEVLITNAFNKVQPDLLDLGEDNYGYESENLAQKCSQRSLRSVNDQSTYRKRNWKEAATHSFNRTQKPCELKEMGKVEYCTDYGRPKEYPVMVSKHSDLLRREFGNSRSGNYYGKAADQHSRKNENFEKKLSRKQESNCEIHRRKRCRGDYDHHRANCEIYRETSETMESLRNEEPCRHSCVNQGCPIAAYLPLLLSHCCNQRMVAEFGCKRKINRCCSEAKPRVCSRRRKPCTVHEKPRTRVHSFEERQPELDVYDEVDHEEDGEIDCIDGKTYIVSGKSETRNVRRGNSLSFMKSAEPPVILSYRRSVDTATDVLEAEQKSDMSCQTEPTTSNCSTQAKPTVRHSVTQYSAKVNHCNKDTQCVTHTSSVCTQAVVFEPLDRATQFPERRENHHKQTQCNLATGRKSVQVNLKYKPNPGGYNYGTGSSYHRKDDYFQDCSFRSSQSSYMLPPDLSTNLTIVAPKTAPPSAVAALAAATASADFQPKGETSRELGDQRAKEFDVSPVTLRCSVMSVRPVEMFSNENLMGVNELSGEDCVDEGRQRALSLRNSSADHSELSHCSRSRGKSVSFPTDIARFFDHPSNPQQRVASDDSDSSDGIEVRTSKYCDYLK